MTRIMIATTAPKTVIKFIWDMGSGGTVNSFLRFILPHNRGIVYIESEQFYTRFLIEKVLIDEV